MDRLMTARHVKLTDRLIALLVAAAWVGSPAAWAAPEDDGPSRALTLRLVAEQAIEDIGAEDEHLAAEMRDLLPEMVDEYAGAQRPALFEEVERTMVMEREMAEAAEDHDVPAAEAARAWLASQESQVRQGHLEQVAAHEDRFEEMMEEFREFQDGDLLPAIQLALLNEQEDEVEGLGGDPRDSADVNLARLDDAAAAADDDDATTVPVAASVVPAVDERTDDGERNPVVVAAAVVEDLLGEGLTPVAGPLPVEDPLPVPVDLPPPLVEEPPPLVEEPPPVAEEPPPVVEEPPPVEEDDSDRPRGGGRPER